MLACLTPFEPLVENEMLLPGHLQIAERLPNFLPSNYPSSPLDTRYVQFTTNCPDSTLADFQRQLVELKREIELLKEQYKTLNAFLETESQIVISTGYRNLIALFKSLITEPTNQKTIKASAN